MFQSRSLVKIRDFVVSATLIISICNLQYTTSHPSLTDLIDDIEVYEPPLDLSPKDKNSLCSRHTPTTSEEFIMKFTPCKSVAALKCEIGGAENCFRDKQAFKTVSRIDTSMLECMLEAKTEYLKKIRFVIKTKLLKNIDGSRSIGGDDDDDEDEKQTQRGKCTLGYTCGEDLKSDQTYLKGLKVDCYSFIYDENEQFENGTNNALHFRWTAPPNYSGPIDFSVMVSASFSEFQVNISSANIRLPIQPSDYDSPTTTDIVITKYNSATTQASATSAESESEEKSTPGPTTTSGTDSSIRESTSTVSDR